MADRGRRFSIAVSILALAVLQTFPPSADARAIVITQTAGTKITGEACALLEKECFITNEGVSGKVPTGIIMEAAWLQPRERADIAVLLACFATLGIRSTLELPATRFNDEPMDQFMAFGQVLLERATTEPIGATRKVAEAIVSGGDAFLLIDDFVPHAGSQVRRHFQVRKKAMPILVTALVTEPKGKVSLTGPDGKDVPPARRTAKCIQWEIKSPKSGSWTFTVDRTLRTRLFAQTRSPAAHPRMTCHALIGRAIPVDSRVKSWRLERLTGAGFKAVSNLRSDSGFQLGEQGLYAVTMSSAQDSQEYLFREGVFAGAPPPILFRSTPRARHNPAGNTAYGCGLFGFGLGSPETMKAWFDLEPVEPDVAVLGNRDGLHALSIGLKSPVTLREGPIAVSIQCEVDGRIVRDSWTFIVDRPVPSDLRLSEIHPEEGWIELEALDDIDDLSGYGITDFESGPHALPKRSLRNGDRAVVIFRNRAHSKGTNFISLTGLLSVGGRDQLALVRGTGDEFAVIDAVVFDDGSRTKWSDDELKDNGFLAENGEWSGAPILLSGKSASSARSAATDANMAKDWRMSFYPTPAAANRVDPALAAIGPGDVVLSEISLWRREGKWIEIEVRKGPVDIAAFSLSDLDGEPLRLGAEPRILGSGERLVIHFGQETRRPAGDEIESFDEPPAATADQSVLLLGPKIIDAVAWSGPGVRIPADEAKDNANLKLTPLHLPSTVPGTLPPVLVRAARNQWVWNGTPTRGRENTPVPPPPAAALRIAAVSPSEFSSDWAELVCLAGPIDISRFTLTDMDGHDAPLADAAVTVKPGERILVHWKKGRDETDEAGDLNGNGVCDIYLEGQQPLSTSDDQLVLVWGGTIHDAVVFTNGDGKMTADEKKDLKYLIDAGKWAGPLGQDAGVNVGNYRLPVERIDPKRAGNSKNDWRNRAPRKR